MVDRAGPLLFALVLLLASPGLAGCVGTDGSGDGVVVTSQPLFDAFHRLGAEDELSAVPDWTIADEAPAAERVGRPFVVEAEEVVRLGPELVLDQPHPLVSGPAREAMATGVQQAGITYEQVPTEARLHTIQQVLAAAGEAANTPHEEAWQQVRADLAELNRTLEGSPGPSALFLFPASLVAGAGTDAGLVLELAGMRNAAADAGLEGYAQITSEAVQRTGVDRVIATATMHASPEEIAARPMFEGTAVEDRPERVLVVDPSHTTRLGPHVAQAAEDLATWSHAEIPGPQVSPRVDPYEGLACETVTIETQAPNATVRLLGEDHEPGQIRVPDVPEGHYRVLVTAQDASGTARMETMITVEGSACG